MTEPAFADMQTLASALSRHAREAAEWAARGRLSKRETIRAMLQIIITAAELSRELLLSEHAADG